VVSRVAVSLPGLPPGGVGRGLGGLLIGSGGVLLFLLLRTTPSVAESLLGSGPYPEAIRWLSLLTSWVPISLLEVMALGLLLRVGIVLRRGVRLRQRGELAPLSLLGSGVGTLVRDLGVLLFLFYLLWGFQYARPGLSAHLGMEAAGEVEVWELAALAEGAVEWTNQRYRALHGSDDLGVPTPGQGLSDLAIPLAEGWRRVQVELNLPAHMSKAYGTPKPFLASPLLKRLGVAGMYLPYTGEALVLKDLPGVLQGVDLGHEMAHQRGVASESDANVLGFLVARASPDPALAYAAAAFLQRQLLTALQRIAPERARELARARIPGVQRDYEDLSAFWRPAQTPVGVAATRVNDAMLRSHGIEEGVGSYQGSVWILVAIARARGMEALQHGDP